MDLLFQESWSPYAVGACIGILGCLTLLLSKKTIGCSTAFSKTSGMLEKILWGVKVNGNPYYQKVIPRIDWEWMLVVGIVIGAFISAKLSGQFSVTSIPEVWSSIFGESTATRWIIAFMGGIIMGFGARWAGGCTSGHGISGTMQLAVSSWLSSIFFFIGGIISATIIFHLIGE
ncbi:YeeE/YedE thiosulfate transporter family protein [Candidatus Altiarchaeota archaeon]